MEKNELVPVFMVKQSNMVQDANGNQITIDLNTLWTFKEKTYINDIDCRTFDSYPNKDKQVSIPRMMVPFIMKQIF